MQMAVADFLSRNGGGGLFCVCLHLQCMFVLRVENI